MQVGGVVGRCLPLPPRGWQKDDDHVPGRLNGTESPHSRLQVGADRRVRVRCTREVRVEQDRRPVTRRNEIDAVDLLEARVCRDVLLPIGRLVFIAETAEEASETRQESLRCDDRDPDGLLAECALAVRPVAEQAA